ncbi:MAG: phosphoenolpyruvate carboxykinase [Actinomycetota bacterium]|nr:phosphoenolpyruvate carboxykinase [Actinomycetota bacterium]
MDKIILESGDLCRTPIELVGSKLFAGVSMSFLRSLYGRDSELFQFLCSHGLIEMSEWDDSSDISGLLDILTLLTARTMEEAITKRPEYAALQAGRDMLHEFVEELYNYWRKMERYILVRETYKAVNIMTSDYHNWFRDIVQSFEALVRETYRRVAFNVSGELPKVYRQLPSGAGVGALVERIPWECPGGYYRVLEDISFIQLVVIEPPLIYYPRRNYRRGIIRRVDENPLTGMGELKGNWYCYPAKVGLLLIFVYLHEDFLHLGTSLCNLFELAQGREVNERRPDGILIFGGNAGSLPEDETCFYEDHHNELMIGYVSGIEEHDYFGYLKKTILTLHNSIMINRGMLPLHGAMAHIRLRTGQTANIIIVGDSGAGKSETLEAFRKIAGEGNVTIKVIFDDMGVLGSDNSGRVVAYGTEVGAFVRLDDLNPGYAYSEVDRSIFMNPQLINARVVIPISEFSYITRGHAVDAMLYANNYEEVDGEHPILEFFSDIGEAMPLFERGARLAKGTTDEKGLVHSYFANPFGAVQKRKEHKAISRYFFERLLSSGCRIGMLRTRLGIKGHEMRGPEEAATALLEHFFS